MSRVYRDPFDKPQPLRPGMLPFDEKAVIAALDRLFPDKAPGVPILMATPGHKPRNVEGAQLAGECSVCRRVVWLSPSSLNSGPHPLIACVRCVALELPPDHPLRRCG